MPLRARSHHRGDHVRDRVQSPFVMLPLLILLLLAVPGPAPHAPQAAKVVFLITLAGSVLLGASILAAITAFIVFVAAASVKARATRGLT